MIQVMVVEDQRSSAQRYAAWINEFGHGFVVSAVCSQAAEALEEARRSPPGVIFTDIRLPGQDGLAMLEELRRSGWSGQSVVVSGHNDFSYAQRAIHLQAVEYLLKPVFPEDMRRVLESLLPRLSQCEESVESFLLRRPRSSFPLFIGRALAYVSLNYSRHLSLAEAAAHAFVSSAYLSTSFRRSCGCTFVEYIRRYRIEVAKRLLASGSATLDEVAHQVGISDVAYFNKLFKRVEHTTPGSWRRSCRSAGA